MQVNPVASGLVASQSLPAADVGEVSGAGASSAPKVDRVELSAAVSQKASGRDGDGDND
jgi:hypothetical protein